TAALGIRRRFVGPRRSNQNYRSDGDRYAYLLHDQFLSRERVFRFNPLIALRATILPRSGASPERLSLRPRHFPPPWSVATGLTGRQIFISNKRCSEGQPGGRFG